MSDRVQHGKSSDAPAAARASRAGCPRRRGWTRRLSQRAADTRASSKERRQVCSCVGRQRATASRLDPTSAQTYGRGQTVTVRRQRAAPMRVQAGRKTHRLYATAATLAAATNELSDAMSCPPTSSLRGGAPPASSASVTEALRRRLWLVRLWLVRLATCSMPGCPRRELVLVLLGPHVRAAGQPEKHGLTQFSVRHRLAGLWHQPLACPLALAGLTHISSRRSWLPRLSNSAVVFKSSRAPLRNLLAAAANGARGRTLSAAPPSAANALRTANAPGALQRRS